MRMEKIFTTEGAVKPDIHYCLNPLRRINIDEVETLIDAQKYFILHAPRQTGKTTSLLALRNYLNQQGRYVAVYANVEGDKEERSMDDFIEEISQKIEEAAKQAVMWNGNKDDGNRSAQLTNLLRQISIAFQRPVVLFLDGIDNYNGDYLLAILRQIRIGHSERPTSFPQSIILCGERDKQQLLSSIPDLGGGSPLSCFCDNIISDKKA